MSKLLYVITIIAFSAVVKVNSLQCYECLNCAKVSDDLVVTCGGTTTAAPTTSVPGQSTTPGRTTANPGQSTTGATGQTTAAPGQSTTEATGQTTAAPGQSTTEATGQTTAAPGQSTTEATGQTTAAPGQSTTEATGQTTAAPGQSTTEATGQTTAAPGQSTEPPADTTTVATNGGTDEEDNSANNAGFVVSRTKRAVLVQEKAPEYVCLTVKVEVNNTEVIGRGCAMDAGDGKVCDGLGIANATCTVCKTDKCNSAASIQLSLVLVLAAALFRLL